MVPRCCLNVTCPSQYIATALEGYGWVILLIAIYVGAIGATLYLANGLLNILNGIVAMPL